MNKNKWQKLRVPSVCTLFRCLLNSYEKGRTSRTSLKKLYMSVE